MTLGLISWYDKVIKLYSGNTADYSVKKLAFLRYAQSCPWNKASLPVGQPTLFLQMAMQKRADLLTWYYTCQVIPLSEMVGLCMLCWYIFSILSLEKINMNGRAPGSLDAISIWCWERREAKGEGGSRGWDGWMAPLTQWTWIWDSEGQGSLVCCCPWGHKETRLAIEQRQ